MAKRGGRGAGKGPGYRGGSGEGGGFCCGKPFRGHGFRLTHPRRIILEVLESEAEYLSAEEIYRSVVDRAGDGIGLATVYRTLQLLEEHGFLHKLESGEGRSRYKLAVGEEEHNRKVFICRRCRKTILGGPLTEKEQNVFQEAEAQKRHEHGFRVQSRVMQFFGLCSECSEQSDIHESKSE